MHLCPLCLSTNTTFYVADKKRDYWQCDRCALVFVLPEYYVSTSDERAQYDLHKNVESDFGYRQFLNRLAEPLLIRVKPQAVGLDFGCGPGPVLASMIRSVGHRVELFDIFYQPDESVFLHQYDFITATEVFEHLHHPHDELSRLWLCLHNEGYLALMTKLVKDKASFINWHYKIDPTHVCFYSKDTFEYIARTLSARVEFMGADVIFLQKIKH